MVSEAQNDVVLVFCPYGDFDVQLSNPYLKGTLNKYGVSSICIDLNIEFFDLFGFVKQDRSITHAKIKYSDIDDFINVGNWMSKDLFYEKIYREQKVKDFIDEWVDKIIERKPKLVGFSCFETNILFSVEVAKKLRSKAPGIKIVFGGPDCTNAFNIQNLYSIYNPSLSEGIFDYMAIGEGERTILDLSRHLGFLKDSSPPELKEIKGLYYLDNEKPCFTGVREIAEIIDDIPYPDYSDFEISKYRTVEWPVVFNRGCNYRCVYCNVKNIWSDLTVRLRSAENIVSEMKHHYKLIRDNKLHKLSFKGAYINTSEELMINLSDQIIKEFGPSPELVWSGYTRVHKSLSKNACEKMAQAGCVSLVMGMESASENVVLPMKKAYPVKTTKDILKNISDAGIFCSLFIIVGFPTETEEDFQMTLDFLEENAKNIHSIFCRTEFLLSPEMASDPEKWNLKTPADGYRWETLDGKNTLPIRTKRLLRLYDHLDKVGISKI